MNFFQSILDYTPGAVPVGRIALFLAGLLLSLGIRKVVQIIFKAPAKKVKNFFTLLLDGLSAPMAFLAVFTGFYFSFKLLDLKNTFDMVALNIIQVLLTLTAIRIIFVLIDEVATKMTELTKQTESQLDDQLVPVLRKTAKIAVAAIGIVFFMQLKNYPVSGIIAGLGIGGLAFAFAAQDSIAGIFASIALFLDRPFMVGDFIQVGSVTGVVEEVGLRSTRIRTVEKTLVSIPNKEIVDSTINNLSKRPMRRCSMTIGVTYDTTKEKMDRLVSQLRDMLTEDEMVENESINVHFTEFADSSLNVQIMFFLKTTDYAEFLQAQQEVNLKIMDVVEKLGLDFAFPTTTVYLEK